MSQIVDDLRQVAIEIKTETQVGGNTAARVGGAFERVADALEGTQQIEDMDAAVAAVQQAAQENEQTIQNIVNNLAVVQETGQSASDVMSQKAVTDNFSEIVEAIKTTKTSISSYYTNIDFIINPSTGKWSTAQSGQHSKIVPIPNGIKEIKLKPTSNVMMWTFLSDYTRAAKGGTPSFATGLDRRYTSSEEVVVKQWSNAKFICVRADTSDLTSAYFPEITFVIVNPKEEIEENTQDITDLSKVALSEVGDVALGTLYAGYVKDDGTWMVSTTDNSHMSAHYKVSVNGGMFRVDASDVDSVLYWANSNESAVDGADAPIVGNKIVVSANTSKIITPPNNATYLLVMAQHYLENLLPSRIVKVSNSDAIVNIIPDYIVEDAVAIDISSLTQRNGTFDGYGNWNTTYGKHKAIPVTSGDKFVVVGDGKGFWAWLTNSYSPNPQHGSAVPYVAGYQRVLQDGAVAITAPEGAAYLVFSTVNGSGTASSWSIYKVSSYKKRYPNELKKFRLATWNIGQFLYVDWTGGATHVIPADQADAVALRYKKLINEINADVFGVCEYNTTYSAASLPTRNVIFQCYQNVAVGSKTGANRKSMFANMFNLLHYEEIVFTQNSGNRTYLHVTSRYHGENIHIVEAHMDYTSDEIRASQIAQIINAMAGFRYVIIAGDFNTNSSTAISSDIQAFTDAGYTAANGGYLGIYSTSYVGHPVDHIMAKGFAMSDIQVVQESVTLSDHMLLYCDLTMLDV